MHLQLHSSWHLMLILTQEHTFLITNHQDTHQAVSDSNIDSISAIQIWKTNNWKKILFFFCPLWMVLSHSLSSALHEWKDTLRLTGWLLILLCNKSLLQIFQIVEYLSAWCNKSNTYLLFFSCLKVSYTFFVHILPANRPLLDLRTIQEERKEYFKKRKKERKWQRKSNSAGLTRMNTHTHTFVRTHCPSCYVVTKGQGVHLRAASWA